MSYRNSAGMLKDDRAHDNESSAIHLRDSVAEDRDVTDGKNISQTPPLPSSCTTTRNKGRNLKDRISPKSCNMIFVPHVMLFMLVCWLPALVLNSCAAVSPSSLFA